MLKRAFGKCGYSHSSLGFGSMRLPHEKDDVSKVREGEAIAMIRRAIDGGVTYVDTAYGYHGGRSEVVVGRALAGGYRERVMLADKLPVWLTKEPADFGRIFTEQTERLGVSTIDLYLLHSLDRASWRRVYDMGVLDFLVEQREKGLVRTLGFSFHDDYDAFREIVDAFDWDFCQIMLNYVDTQYQAGVRGLEYASSKGLGVVVMEPLRGGKLAANLPSEVLEILSSVHPDWSPAEWALRAVLNWPEVSLVLSGMSTMEQVEQNLKIASEAGPGNLGKAELEALERAREVFMARMRVGCTECGYCQPCPRGVIIPDIFSIYNTGHMFNSISSAQRQYASIVRAEKDASRCVKCGRCEKICPQGLKVMELLVQADAELSPAE